MAKTKTPQTKSPKPAPQSSAGVRKRQKQPVVPEPVIVKVGPKGVITIPEKHRQALQLEPGKYITVSLIGNQLVMSSEINAFMAVTSQAQQILEDQGISPETVLQSQTEARKKLYQELYGSGRKAK